MKILIAHNSLPLRARARAVLEQVGWTVSEADDAAAALRLARELRPDVTLLDATLRRPRATAPLFEELKADPDLRGVRVVLFEAGLDLERALAGIAAGADEFLLEPVTDTEVAVRAATAGRIKTLEDRLAERRADLEGLLHTDPLTGLFNRRFLEPQLRAQISSARRHDRSLAVLLVDLDHFKQINDTHGHHAGDEALRRVGRILRERLRAEDVPARWGGDELVILLPDADADAAERVARALASAVTERTARGPEGTPQVSVSIGVALWCGEDADALLRRADAALYEAKRAGAGNVRIAPAPVPDAPRAAPSARANEPSGFGVVLVDDHLEIRRVLELSLEGTGAHVVGQAGDGRAALEVIAQATPQVVIMDMHMPVMDGLQATRAIRDRFPGIIVVGFTSSDDPRVLQAMRDAGVERHFPKHQLDALVSYLTGPEIVAAIERRRAVENSEN